ncbi:MAG: hypothetical protein ACOYOQ_10460 [Microthrixaceae bacterium]
MTEPITSGVVPASAPPSAPACAARVDAFVATFVAAVDEVGLDQDAARPADRVRALEHVLADLAADVRSDRRIGSCPGAPALVRDRLPAGTADTFNSYSIDGQGITMETIRTQPFFTERHGIEQVVEQLLRLP